MLPFMNGGNPFAQTGEQALAAQAGQQAPAQPEGPGIAAAIGNKLGDAFSGRGLFGGSPDDSEIDPQTGAPKGLARQAGMQSMMQMGLLFLAAGQNMSNDARAAILAKAPALVGGSNDSVNSFAQTRLAMAKLKLEERKALAEEQAGKNIVAAMGGGGAAAGPSAGAQAVQTAQAGTAATGEAVGAPAPAVGASPTPQAPAVAEPGPSASIPPSIAAPGGVPRFSAADRLAVTAQPTTGGKAQMLGQIIQQQQGAETLGKPVWNPNTQKWETPVYNGRGQLVKMQDGGAPPLTERTNNGVKESGYMLPNGQFHVVSTKEMAEDPAAREDRQMRTGILRDNYKDLDKTYVDTVQKTSQSYDKMAKLRKEIQGGAGSFGTGQEAWSFAVKTLASYGMINPEATKDLITNDNFLRATKEGVANVIKAFNGSQGVSNADREFAEKVMSASVSGSRDQVLNALTQGMNDARNVITNYNENADRHNSNLEGMGEQSRKLITLRRVDKDFDAAEREFTDAEPGRRERETGKKPDAPAVPPQALDLLKSDPAKYRAFFDKKYGAGSAAKVLGN